MTRVLHVIPQLSGGAGRVALDLVKHAPDHGLNARLCVLYGSEEKANRDLVAGELSWLGGRPGFRSPANLLALGRGLRRLCRDFQPDIVHSHLRPADLVTAAALAGWPLAHVSHQHDTTASLAGSGARARLKRRLARHLYKRADTCFIFVARAVQDYFAEVFGRWGYEGKVIHNGADERQFTMESPPGHRPCGPLIFGTAARLAPEKGIDILLRAFALLHDRATIPIRLRIAGSGRCEGELRVLAKELAIASSVDFLGQVEEMRGFYNSIDVLVLPSRHSEGLPLTIVEAMLCGRPVVATDVAGVSETVIDSRNGFLVPADEPICLADAMGAMTEGETLMRLSRRAVSDARAQFGLSRTLKEIADFYDAVLERSGDAALVELRAATA
jgi:glycosyltransferase involved in cell wall biosynthesis